MKRQIIKIDEDLCNGCGLCVSGCHEGALQIVDGKASLISELYCDGLGACIGDCPEGAIEIEEREAEPYDEVQVIDRMIAKGENVIKAHLNHLKDFGELGHLQEGIDRLKEKNIEIDFSFLNIEKEQTKNKESNKNLINIEFKEMTHSHQGGGCPGSAARMLIHDENTAKTANVSSQLRQWPVQLHLINPNMQMFEGKDVLLAADCVPFAMGDFHASLLSGKMLAIACPKLDSGKEIYIEKLKTLIEERKINTLTVAIMEVPYCHGLLQIAQQAVSISKRKIPVKLINVSIAGSIIDENWV